MSPLIDSIEIHHYRIPLDPPFNAAWDPQPRREQPVTLVRLRAGEYEGVGSGDAMLGFAGHEELFLGHDPFAIERHVQILDNLQFHFGRMWPLEVALWDLMGQITGQPLWQLLGGRRREVPLYASTGERMAPAARAEMARGLRDEGFAALKIRFHSDDLRADLAIAQAVRAAVGHDMALLVDANRAWRMPWEDAPPWDFKTAVWVADGLAELDAFWLEEPLHRHDYEGLARLRARSRVRIAGGEGNREISELRQYLRHGSLDVYQPDVVWSTGIWRARQIAAEVQARGDIYSPHTWGEGLVLLANLHVAAAVSTAPFIEFPYDPPHWTPERRDFLLAEPILPQPVDVDGNGRSRQAITLSDRPGLGATIAWDKIAPFKQ